METTSLPVIGLDGLEEGLQALGVVKRKITRVDSLASVQSDTGLSEEQRKQFAYAPKVEVAFVEGSEDLWFRTRGGNWAATFVMLPHDHVLLTAEYVTGADIVLIGHCAGMPQKGETMEQCAIRETEEESGVVLSCVAPLSAGGLPVSARKSSERVFPYVGFPRYVAGELVIVPPRPDKNEAIKAFQMPLDDYWRFLDADRFANGVVHRDCAYAGLRRLGLLWIPSL